MEGNAFGVAKRKQGWFCGNQDFMIGSLEQCSIDHSIDLKEGDGFGAESVPQGWLIGERLGGFRQEEDESGG
jgi:hypothetical protein